MLRIKLGTFREGEHILDALKNASVACSTDVSRLLTDLKMIKSKKDMIITVKTPKDFGYPHGARWEFIIKEARKQKLGLCPTETAALLLIQNEKVLKRDKKYVVVSQSFPIQSGGELEYVMYVRRTSYPGEGGSIYVERLMQDTFVKGNKRLVFVCE